MVGFLTPITYQLFSFISLGSCQEIFCLFLEAALLKKIIFYVKVNTCYLPH